MSNIKTRFAPSPTGDLHIGGVRTALYAYLFAKKNNGQFLLRIEDTDQSRYKEGSEDSIFDALNWVGLNHDGQAIHQSHRTKIYQKYAQQLVDEGKAYYCFCSANTLGEMRQQQIEAGQSAKYDGRCLKLSKEEIKEKIANNEPYVIRLNLSAVETDDKIVFEDLIRGHVEFDVKDIDDQVLLKSDGYPTYHLANVIDDHESGITHVIRAEEWLPSTPKHIILYQYFGWQPPKFAHLPMVLAPDKSKLSKRHGATNVMEFKELGYLPETLINYLALLGWNPGDEREIFSLDELIKEFSIEKVHKAGAVFDKEKLDWMNGHYIRQTDVNKLTAMCIPYLQQAGLVEDPENEIGGKRFDNLKYVKQVVALEQERLKKISDIVEATEYFFKEKLDYEKELLKWKKSDLASAKQKLSFLAEELAKIPNENWTRASLEELIVDLIKNHDLGTGDTLWPMRTALTGRERSPGPFEVAEVLGKDETLRRLKIAVDKI